MERRPTVWPYIKGLTKDELDNVIPLVSKGWASQTKEFDTYEFTKDNGTLQGDIPTDLRGTFIRNGPGLNDVFGVPLLHPIDGDGMVVQVSFENGRACLKSRYVNTFSHVAEQKAQKMLHPGQMGTKVPGQTKPNKWRDPSHTNVFSWGGKLVACHEYSLPHALDPISMETLGEDSMKGNLSKIRTLGAHFRYDADLDLLVTVSFRPGGPIESGVPPQLEIHEFDRQWNAVRKTVCSIPGLNYSHDLLVTPDFYIVQMTPFIKVTVESMKEIKDGKFGPGQQMRYHPDLPSKMIVIERDLQKKVNIAPRYIGLDAEPCHIYHFANCRQSTAVDGSTVIRFDACCLPPGFTMEWQHKAFLSNTLDAPGVMQHYEIVLGAKEMYCKRTMIDELKEFSCEFPTTHPYRHCLRDSNVSNRYTYIMSSQPGVALPFTCVVKHDAIKKSTTRWNAEGVVGEPCFIPRLGYASAKYGDEDDGYVIVQHYLYKEGRTEFCILDAKNVQGGPICRLKLPERIPFGFHGTYTPDVFLHPKAKL